MWNDLALNLKQFFSKFLSFAITCTVPMHVRNLCVVYCVHKFSEHLSNLNVICLFSESRLTCVFLSRNLFSRLNDMFVWMTGNSGV